MPSQPLSQPLLHTVVCMNSPGCLLACSMPHATFERLMELSLLALFGRAALCILIMCWCAHTQHFEHLCQVFCRLHQAGLHLETLFSCAVECLMHVHARKLQFMHFQGLRVCTEDCVRYLYISKHKFIRCHDPYMCAEDCTMYVHARKCQFVLD